MSGIKFIPLIVKDNEYENIQRVFGFKTYR